MLGQLRFQAIELLLLLMAGNRYVTSEPSQISLNHRSFADSLTTDLYENENECTSTWGISMAFSLVYPSADEATAGQIELVMGYPPGGTQNLVWNETATRLDNAYERQCLEPTSNGGCNLWVPILEIANSVWIDDGSQLRPAYQAVVQDYIQQIDFDDSSAGGIVNDWVNASTRGLIDSIVEEGPIDAILIAINSIYLNAPWSEPFSVDKTTEEAFYMSPTRATETSSRAHFMHNVLDSVPYSHDAVPGYQLMQLRFTGSLSMIFALPASELLNNDVSSTMVLGALPQLRSTRLAVALPKFQFESEYRDSLKDSLRAIGLTAPFEGGLCVFSGGACASIDQIIQKTFVDLNEDGVEAAAVTAIILETGAPNTNRPVLFLVDHPFQFFIYDTVEELVIFEGRVSNPGIADNAPTPTLSASHDDIGFWQSNFGVEEPSSPDFDDFTQQPTDPSTSSASFDFTVSLFWLIMRMLVGQLVS